MVAHDQGRRDAVRDRAAQRSASQPTGVYGAGTTGNPVYIDGVPVSLGAGGNTDASGKIAGLLQLRDGVAVTMQSQLDEIARGLITAFAETDRPTALPDAPGLFTWSGAPAMPAAGTLVNGPRRLDHAQRRDRFRARAAIRNCCATAAPTARATSHNTGGDAAYSDLLI